MRAQFSILDRYLLLNLCGAFSSIFLIVISLMLVEDLPHLFEVARFSGARVYVVAASLGSLVPEYAAIGLLFGLYVGMGTTLRRLSVRRELDAIEAAGIAPRRWMRFPMAGAIVVAVLLLWTEGWLMPAGERRLTELSDAIVGGAYGSTLEGRQFTDVADGGAINFKRVNPTTGELEGVFYHTGHTVLSAARGRLGFNPRGDMLIELSDGRAIDEEEGRVISFARITLTNSTRAAPGKLALDELEQRNESSLPVLLLSANRADRAMAWSRLLWPAFALVLPMLAWILSKPGHGNDGWMGLLAGVVLVVLFIRCTDFVAATTVASPPVVAITMVCVWGGVIGLLAWGERCYGVGYVDAWLRALTRTLATSWRRQR